MKKAVVLLSGGLDSSTVLFWARQKGYLCHCLIIDYGQRHEKELNSAKKIAKTANCPYKIIKINLPWNKSSLVDKNQKIPVNKVLKNRLPSTYVPGRNTIFIAFALSYAETIGAKDIFIGANSVDFSGYPDCRPNYYRAINKVFKALGTGIKVNAPILKFTKSGIVKLGLRLGVPYRLTWSCYQGGKKPCGVCDSCKFRKKGFGQAKASDPLI
ncbi:MAG: 7-cyano-7-deazaguanine synthase QueC [Elusimicrobia bacterium]|nr:7-cyano-7-deazaguanine synthase QueC [Candidatus Liberimonas magnetica]